jgi:phosphoribosylformylglycinamidine synthase
MGVVGILEDVHKAIGSDFQDTGRALVLLRGSEPGDASDVEAEFGSSEYAKEVLGHLWGFPPSLEIGKEAALQKAIVQMINEGLVETAKDCAEGGLGVTLAECGFARGIGAQVTVEAAGLVPEFVLFGEDASRILISCDQRYLQRIKQVAALYGLSAENIGVTVPDNLEISVDGKPAASAPVSELKTVWAKALEEALRIETEEQ